MKKLITAMLVLGLAMVGTASAQTPVSSDITSDTTWSSDMLLQGAIFVTSGATLTIEKGVTVYGEKSSIGTLVVAQGAKLNINGTADEPVVFTSDQASPNRGDWGGLIINGYAPLNVDGGVAEGEGDTGQFGGNNAADNSGTMQYFRVEYAGIEFSPDNELNGIALQGVGTGTTLDHFQVHANKDDGIEMFGGTVNWKYGIFTQCADDSVDWTQGWTGSAQFAVVQQKGDDADRGIEADNLEENNDATPRANPTLYNFTFIGDPTNGEESKDGLLLRRGTAGTFRNFIVTGFKGYGVDIDDESTFDQAESGALTFNNSIFFNNAKGNFSEDSDDTDSGIAIPFSTDTFMTTNMDSNLESDPKLGDAFDLDDPDFRPAATSPAVDGTISAAAKPPTNSFIVDTDYIGAVDPDSDWTRQPWTMWGTASWTEEEEPPEPECTDSDGDGYSVEGGACGEVDCDDSDAAVNPGATEVCGDGVDNDCDGQIDENCDSSNCPVTMILGEDNTGLDVLRSFRDAVLAKTAAGSLYTQLYYHYGADVVDMIAADATLRAKTERALAAVMPAVDAALQGEEAQIDAETSAQLLDVLDAVGTKAGIGLKIAIFKAKMDIVRGNLPF